jgi:hypothetical protein
VETARAGVEEARGNESRKVGQRDGGGLMDVLGLAGSWKDSG